MFANDAAVQRNNTQAIDVGGNTLVAAHVTDYKAAAVPAFDAVKDAVRQKVIAAQSNEAAHKDGVAKLAELRKVEGHDRFLVAVEGVAQRRPRRAAGCIERNLQSRGAKIARLRRC